MTYLSRSATSVDARLERIETRLCKLMVAMGIDPASGERVRADHGFIYEEARGVWRVTLSNERGTATFHSRSEAVSWTSERADTWEVCGG